ncbi:MAG: hypothetical protein LBI60_05375 [Bacteroidales bacterium]|jgi:hypothetical protein|nr:hypothetical protein [Bacteroidales bacterium]
MEKSITISQPDMTHKEVINEMKKYFSKDMPEVGIFWYDENNNELFETYSIPIDELKEGQRTYPKLHKTIWQKLKQKNQEKKKTGKSYNPIYLTDYTMIPRGRIFFKDNLFYVFVGSWIDKLD